MNLCLTMAGKYSRFKLFGSKIPKYLLPLGSETILAEVIKQYKKSIPLCKIYLIANRDDQIFYPIVKSIMRKYDVEDKSIIYIDDTSTQLQTALYISELLPVEQMNAKIAFSNIDTILFDRSSFFEKLTNCEKETAIIDTFLADNKQYSYAIIDNSGKVVDISDKNNISETACSGLYGFGSFQYMSVNAKEILQGDGESNFTDLYKYYLNKEKKVIANKMETFGNTIVLGTPEEYVINIHKFK